MKLRRYWIKFQTAPTDRLLPGMRFGYGVTAYDYDDALQILRWQAFDNAPLPLVASVIEDVDVSTLDAGHILPNMHPPNRRGIWFPMGYA